METRIKGVLSPKASGSITITENGNYDVVDVANAIVNVVPEEVGGITPEGSITLTSNGVYDVTMYAEAVVDVENVIPEGYVKPEGTLNVTSNGTFDVTEKKNVSVNVPQPSGTIEITENGVVDVTNYANANVNVASSGGGMTKKEMYKELVDGRRNADYLFYGWNRLENINDLIDYNTFENALSMINTFLNCSYITSFPPLNTSKVTNMIGAFKSTGITDVPIINTSLVTNMESILQITKITEYNNNFDTSNVTSIREMFASCSNIKKIKINTPKVTQMYGAFRYCPVLEIVDISYYGLTSTSSSESMLYNTKTTLLKAFVIREFGTKYVLNKYAFEGTVIYQGTGGYILVPRAMVDTLKSATNWSTYADRIFALEDYTIDGTTTGEIDESKLV